MTALYQKQTIREIEQAVYQQEIATDWALMQKAGQVAFTKMTKRWPTAKQVTVICGKGNNAGDGLVLAHEAHLRGLSVFIYLLADQADYQGPAKKALDLCLSSGMTTQSFTKETVLSGDVLIDAIFGIGLSDDITGLFATAVEAINTSKTPVLALDIASGIDADTGAVLGCAVQATATVTFIAPKQGLYTGKGIACSGEIIVDDLKIPATILSNYAASAQLMQPHRFPMRARDAHKGDFGHVLVIGGDYGMGGAVRMAAEAALRVGAGLVTVVTRPEHVCIVSGSRPEIMCHQVSGAEDLLPLIDKASVYVIGPGLGKSDWAKSLLSVIVHSEKPCLLDADALNLLSQMPTKNKHWVLTPHPAEAARLLNESVSKVQENRFVAAKSIADNYAGVCVLKGAGTIVQSDNVLPRICVDGNPGMATAGMGDVLSGVVGGLLAQGYSCEKAAEVGVLLHAQAADLAVKGKGERGLLASDLMMPLRELVNQEIHHVA